MSVIVSENCNYEVTPVVKQKVERLTLDEKISLVELLWNDIHRSNSRIEPDEEESNYVEQRLKEVDESPEAWLNWDQVMRIVRRKHA